VKKILYELVICPWAWGVYRS